MNRGQYSGFSISCNCASVYTAGTTVVFRLRCSNVGDVEAGLKIRAVGTIHVEKRWVKSTLGDKLMSGMFPSSVGDPSQLSYVFLTDYVSPLESKKSPLKEEEVFIQFDIPMDALPSFKGLSVLIQYNLEINVDKMKPILFPFTVEGEGSSDIQPYHCRKGIITYFTSLDLSEEAQFSRPYQPDPSLVFFLVKDTASIYDTDAVVRSRGDGMSQRSTPIAALSSHSFNISNEGNLICTLHILRAGFGKFLLPGDDLNIRLDFLESTHPCCGIRAKITQKELRRDNSRMQEKVVAVMAKGTDSAVLLNISLPIPVDAAATFDCPIAKVRYYLDVAFFLESAPSAEPYVWSIPLTIAPRYSIALLDEAESKAVNLLEMTHYWPRTAPDEA
jgi:hypothetical protein